MEKDLEAKPHRADDLSSSFFEKKRIAINEACERHDLVELANLADTAGGLLDDALRKSAWPILLNSVTDHSPEEADTESWQDLPSHGDEEQVQLDVNRSFVYDTKKPEKAIERDRVTLFNLTARILRTHRMLCYFQGYHDIVQVLLLVLGEDAAFSAASRLSLFRIRDCMLPSLTPFLKHLQLIPAILKLVDPSLARHLSSTSPFHALSATLTLYAHDVQDYNQITRVFDFILAHEPVVLIYLYTANIIRRRSELLEIPMDDPDMLHFMLSKQSQRLDIESLIDETLQLFRGCPPEALPGRTWAKIPSSSVLKTSRDIFKYQEEKDAERLFEKQRWEMKKEEFIGKSLKQVARNRRPLLSITAAFMVGAISIWLRRTGYDRTALVAIWRMYHYVLKSR